MMVLFTHQLFSQVGDSCGNAVQINTFPGTYAFSTDTGYTDNYISNCGGYGPDMVFQFNIPADSSLMFWVTNNDFDLVLSLIGDSCNGTELICNDDPDSDTLYFLNNTSGQALSVWLIVDGYYSGGNGDLNWDYVHYISPLGNTCDDAIHLNGPSGNLLYNTDSLGFTNSSPISGCNAYGNDLYLLLDTLQPLQTIDFWITDDNYDVVIYMGQGDVCQDNPTFICHDDDDSDTLSHTNFTSSPQPLWVIVDGYSFGGGAGNFHWDIHSVPVINNGALCDSSIVLVGDSGDYAYNSDSTGFYNTSPNTYCNGAGNDIFFSLQDSLQPGYSIDIWTTDSDYDVVISMGTGDICQDGPTLICHDQPDGDVQTYNNMGTNPINLWITADGYYSGGGHAILHWAIYSSPPSGPGHNCDTALVLTGMSGSYYYNTDSVGYTNSSPKSDCNQDGNDMYIQLDTLQPGYSIDIWTTDDNFDYDVVLYMGTGDLCQDNTPLVCHDDPDGGVVTYSNAGGSALNLWVILDGYYSGGGQANFNWNIYNTPPSAPGSYCYNPIVLNDSMGSYAYNTDSSVFHDFDPLFSCDAGGNNMYFSFSDSLNPGDTLTFYTTDDNYDVVIAAGFGSCIDNSITEVICHDDTDGDTLLLINDSSFAQAVWIMVDGYLDNGSAILHWEFSTPDVITSTSLLNAKDIFKLWPNPSNGNVTISVPPASFDASCSIEVRDLTSHIVYQNKVSKPIYNLDLSYLSSGFYSVTVVQNGVRYTQSIILNK